MDITLIKQADFFWNEKQKQNILSEEGIANVSDCAMILLHKSGLRPLYVINEKNEEEIHEAPKEKQEKPDLILCPSTDIGKQSARILQEQLKVVSDCSAKILPLDFSIINKTDNLSILKNILQTRAKSFTKKGYKHLVIISEKEDLAKIARCMNKTELKDHNFPIYSFSNGQEIEDEFLTTGIYATREMMDTLLIRAYNIQFGKKIHQLLPGYIIRKKLHLPE